MLTAVHRVPAGARRQGTASAATGTLVVSRWLLAGMVMIAAGVLALDLALPLGVATGVAYVVVVLLALWLPRRRHTLIVATGCTVLTVLGFLLSPLGGVAWMVVANRLLSVLAIWVTAALGLLLKRADEVLVDREARIGAILDTAADGIITFDEQGKIESFNRAAGDMFGYSADELIGRQVALLFPAARSPDGNGPAAEVLQAIVFGEEGVRCEVQGQRKDRTTFPLDLSVSKVQVGGRRVLTGILRDVSERRRIEQALRDETQFAEGLIQTAQVIVLVLDTSGRIVRFNPYMERLSGYRLDDVRGKDWFQTFLPQRDQFNIRRLFRKALSDIQTQGNINSIVTKSGTEREVAWWDKTLKNSQGNVVGMLSVGLDTTELKQTKNAVRETEERFRRLVETSQVIPWEADLVTWRFIYVGHQAVTILGYPLERWFESDFWIDHIHPDDRERTVRHCREYASCGRPYDLQYRMQAAEGRSVWLHDFATVVADKNNRRILQGFMFDVTELKEAQRRALQAERLAAVGEAMAGLAHESRNALQRSQACLEMLARRVEGQKDALDLIVRLQKAQDDLHRLYEEVREYSAPMTLNPELGRLSDILKDTWESLTPSWETREVQFREAARTADLRCEVDCFAMRQVFRNVLENALAACQDPVEIDVGYSEAEIDRCPAVRIRLRDNGPGLTPEQKKRIFDPFYTTKTKGTGLGMAIAKRIVEAHGGRIAVGPSSNGGAEIVLTLPKGQ